MMKTPSFRVYIVVSLLAHIMIVGLMLVVEYWTPKKVASEALTIDFVNSEELAQQQVSAPKIKQQAPHIAANQIVEQQSQNENDPVNTRFLSEKNQTVKKQTVAAARGQFQNLKKQALQKPGSKGDGKLKSETLAKDLFKGFDPNEALERKLLAEQEAGKGLGKGSSDDENSNAKGEDISQTNDYIKDVDTGLETMLNTREFKYYSYYSRIRRQLSQHWEGRVRDKLSKLFKEGRAPAATGKDRITKLMIVLNDKGTLVRVQVLSDSGVRDLDDAAIEAFRAAAPFPNPPNGIVEKDGTVKIRWDFVLEV